MSEKYSFTLPEEGIYEALLYHRSLDLSPVFCVSYGDEDIPNLEDLVRVMESAFSDEANGYETTAISAQDHIDKSRGTLIVVGPQSTEEDIEQVATEVCEARAWYQILGLIVHEDTLSESSAIQRVQDTTSVSESTSMMRPWVFEVADGHVDLSEYYPVSRIDLSRILVETR